MTTDYKPFLHTIVDKNGFYLFNKVPKGMNYKIFAIAPGKKLTKGYTFSITGNKPIEVNFILEDDQSLRLNVISGDVLDGKTLKPVNGAIVSLLKKHCEKPEILQSIVHTNPYGQFIFSEIDIGCYIIRIASSGYTSKSIDININCCGQIFPMIIKICPTINYYSGTVSGIITDENNYPIERADVILYKIKTDNSLIPIAFTKTNEAGVYLFINIPKGCYKIKSNKTNFLNININPNHKESVTPHKIKNLGLNKSDEL